MEEDELPTQFSLQTAILLMFGAAIVLALNLLWFGAVAFIVDLILVNAIAILSINFAQKVAKRIIKAGPNSVVISFFLGMAHFAVIVLLLVGLTLTVVKLVDLLK